MEISKYDSDDVWSALCEIDNSEEKNQSPFSICEQCYSKIEIIGYHLKYCPDCRKANTYRLMADEEIAELRKKLMPPRFRKDIII